MKIADDAIDESYGVAVVFHEDEEDDREMGGRGEGGGRNRESMIAHDDDDVEADDEDEGMEADYDEVLKTAVRELIDYCQYVIRSSKFKKNNENFPLWGNELQTMNI